MRSMIGQLFIHSFLLFLTILFAVSTDVNAVSEEAMNSWLDKPESRIIDQWGMPDNSVNLKEPELFKNHRLIKMIVYYHFTSITEPGKSETIMILGRAYTTNEPPKKRNFKYTLMFWVDEEGFIRKWSKRVQELF